MIVLMTDFGAKDPFVGIMKGVMLGLYPNLTIVDLTHEIPPQDVAEGAFVLRTSSSYFPKGSLFVTVVDPGVGSGRRILYAETERYRFIAPDNGILGMVLEASQSARVFEVANPKYFLSPVSHTFHGRDIFAPVAAHISIGLNPEELGPRIPRENLVTLPFPAAHRDDGGSWHGSVVYIDRFGNLVTNLWQSLLNLTGKESVEVRLKGQTLKGLVKSYAGQKGGQDVRDPLGARIVTDEDSYTDEDSPAQSRNGGAVVLLNSFGAVEIAVNRGNAALALNVKRGEEVVLKCLMSSS